MSKWVSIDKKMPPPKTTVLVWDGYKVFPQRVMSSYEFAQDFCGVSCRNTITHWMPLPEPPEDV